MTFDVTTLVDTFNSGDLDALTAMAHPEMRYVNRSAGLESPSRDGWRAIMEQILVVLPDRRIETRAVATGTDGVHVLEYGYVATAAHPLTLGAVAVAAGDEVELDMCAVLRVENGLLHSWRDYSDG